MLTTNANRNAHRPNSLRPCALGRSTTRSVSFLAFFRGGAPPSLPTRPPPGARVGKGPPLPERKFRQKTHSAQGNPRNRLRPCRMALLAFRRERSENPNTILTMLTDLPRGARARPSSCRPPDPRPRPEPPSPRAAEAS